MLEAQAPGLQPGASERRDNNKSNQKSPSVMVCLSSNTEDGVNRRRPECGTPFFCFTALGKTSKCPLGGPAPAPYLLGDLDCNGKVTVIDTICSRVDRLWLVKGLNYESRGAVDPGFRFAWLGVPCFFAFFFRQELNKPLHFPPVC